MNKEEYRFSTERLLVCEWHSIPPDEWNRVELETVVISTLTPNVTLSLPPGWQGDYTPDRASQWIEERDAEGVTLIVIDKPSLAAIGFVILYLSDDVKVLHLGYILKESAWGKGYATELIKGFIEWSKSRGISKVIGGVSVDNIASIRVLEKSGFRREPDLNDSEEHKYVWESRYNP